MKLFTKPFLALFALTAILSSCDVEKLIDDNFKEKSLVVVAPDFIKNRVTLVFEDAETGEIIDEDLEVNIVSSKRIIDLSGHYKNTFNVKNGILQLAVDPNEEVTENSPFYFSLFKKGYRNDQVYYETQPKNSNQIIRVVDSKLNISTPTSKTITPLSAIEEKPIYFDIKFNDLTPEEYGKFKGFSGPNTIINILDYGDVESLDDTFIRTVSTYTYLNDNKTYKKPNSGPVLDEDLTISINALNKNAWRDTNLHKFQIIYADDEYFYDVSSSGTNEVNLISRKKRYGVENPFYEAKKIIKTNGIKSKYIIKEGSELLYVRHKYNYDLTTIDCEEGFNIKFEGLSEGEAPSLLYRTIRNGEKPTVVSYVNPTVGNEIHNTTGTIGSSHPYGRTSNKIIFSPSFQYEVSPQEMDLGGEDACGKTYTFKVTPRPDTEKYKLNIQFQCAGEDFSTAPSVVAFIREEGSNASDLLNLNNGSSTLHLKSDKNYLVQGDFNGNDFGFTFTANGPAIDLALQKSILENENIQDIQYSFPVINGENVINAKVIFKEGKCPE